MQHIGDIQAPFSFAYFEQFQYSCLALQRTTFCVDGYHEQVLLQSVRCFSIIPDYDDEPHARADAILDAQGCWYTLGCVIISLILLFCYELHIARLNLG